METDLVTRAGIPFTAIPAAGVHGVGLRKLPNNLWKLAQGVAASRRIIAQFHPEALFFTGGYVGVPMAIAGAGLPSLLYVPDIEPGLALKAQALFARRIAVTEADSKRYFGRPSRIVVTGYPTRPDLGAWNRETACRQLGLDASLPVLLVMGGSKGAQTINQAVFPLLPRLLAQAQVVHLTGSVDEAQADTVKTNLPLETASRYHPMAYLHEMGAGLAAANLVVARAGASTLGELPLFSLPAILVPYQYAWRYQKVNAQYLVTHQAAIEIDADELSQRLYPTISALLADPNRLAEMSRAMHALAHSQAAEAIGAVLREMVSEKSGREARHA